MLTSAQLSELIAYDCIEPMGDERADFRIAQLTALTAEINRDSKHRRQPFKPQDFMRFSQEKKKVQTPADQVALLKLVDAVNAGAR